MKTSSIGERSYYVGVGVYIGQSGKHVWNVYSLILEDLNINGTKGKILRRGGK